MLRRIQCGALQYAMLSLSMSVFPVARLASYQMWGCMRFPGLVLGFMPLGLNSRVGDLQIPRQAAIGAEALRRLTVARVGLESAAKSAPVDGRASSSYSESGPTTLRFRLGQ